MLLIRWKLLIALLMSSAVVLSQPTTVCKPQPMLSSCPATPDCEGIVRKAYSAGCTGKNGKKLLDGGCQCKGYCGYKCAAACRADPECSWHGAMKTCFSLATKLPGKPIARCEVTPSPTHSLTVAPTKSPTRAPSHSPSKAPTLPTRSPTQVPTRSPTKSLCHQDTKFPGAPFTNTNSNSLTQAFGISSDGSSVVFSSSYFEYETGSYDEVWVTTRNKATGAWKAQRVLEHFTAEGDYGDTIYPQAAISGNGNFLFVVAGENEKTPGNNCTFYKRDANGIFKMQTRIAMGRRYDAKTMWISATGDRALVSYTDYGAPDQTDKTINFVRVNGAWTIEWIQDKLMLESVSADGNTAFAISIDWHDQYTSRFVYVRQGKQWVKQSGDLVGTGLPSPRYYQGSSASSFTPDGNTLVMGANVLYDDDYSADFAPEDSGAWVFVRSSPGNWTQLGPKLGGGNIYDGYYTSISNDGKTIMFSAGKTPHGFYIFKKAGSTYTQLGGEVMTNSKWPIMDGNGVRVVTSFPVSLWKC